MCDLPLEATAVFSGFSIQHPDEICLTLSLQQTTDPDCVRCITTIDIYIMYDHDLLAGITE